MALTRRTGRFNEIAETFELGLAGHGVELGSDVVDQILRNRIDRVAEVMQVSPRTALGYAPPDLPRILTTTVLKAIELMPADGVGARSHLQLVPPSQ